MTLREKLAIEHPENIREDCIGGCKGCPDMAIYNYASQPDYCPMPDGKKCNEEDCSRCWDREVPEMSKNVDKESNEILDSGDRTEFSTGAVRDMREGKGRCDLMPLISIARYYADKYGVSTDVSPADVFLSLERYGRENDPVFILRALDKAALFDSDETMFLEVAKHFEAGCKKYGENNWRKGIPVKFYIDSAIRHYLKYLRGDKDEHHDRAFCWNLMCAYWTHVNKPEMRNEEETK